MERRDVSRILFIGFFVWMIVIFYFSSQPPNISYTQSGAVVRLIGKVNDLFDIRNTWVYEKLESMILYMWPNIQNRGIYHMVRKSAHFGIYYVLGMLCCGFGYSYSKKQLMGFLLGGSLPVVIAVLDEYNQSFVGRASTLDDVIIDGMGALIGSITVVLLIALAKTAKSLKRKTM